MIGQLIFCFTERTLINYKIDKLFIILVIYLATVLQNNIDAKEIGRLVM